MSWVSDMEGDGEDGLMDGVLGLRDGCERRRWFCLEKVEAAALVRCSWTAATSSGTAARSSWTVAGLGGGRQWGDGEELVDVPAAAVAVAALGHGAVVDLKV